MKERPIQVSALALLVTAALFGGLTWDRWGILAMDPGLRWLVLGAAFFALGVTCVFLRFGRRSARSQPRPAPAAHRGFAAVKSSTGSASRPGCRSQTRKQPVTSPSGYRGAAQLK